MSLSAIGDNQGCPSAGIPRGVEAAIALAGLVLLAPLLALVAIAIRLISPGPVLFRQQRVGLGGREFTMLKFRTMRLTSHGPQVTAAGDERITSVGRLLRRLKLDELPELWNVVRGELSLVGHRPEVPRFVDLEDPLWVRALRERPGITHPVTLGLKDEERLIARAGGDSERFYTEELLPFKLRGYVDYQQRRSAFEDLKILIATVIGLLGRGSYPPVRLEHVRCVRGVEGSACEPARPEKG
jgi:lipopolysaccharide/colanic/teichoic acid biosynthesis glycosyltransferase